MFTIAYWFSLTASITILQVFHHPATYWQYHMDFGFELLALFLTVTPLMAVMFANMKEVRDYLGNNIVERDSVLVSVFLVALALVLLVPVTWSVWYLFDSFTVISAIATIVVVWLAVYVYMVSARAISAVNPVRFMRLCYREPLFWFVFLLASFLISISLIPLLGGFMASEAWQYYPMEELVIRRLPAVVMFGLPSALLIPLLPLTLESLAAERKISWTWD